jgi:hypothetical protein
MAIDTIIVTKETVQRRQHKLFRVSCKLVCEESATEVINEEFSVDYIEGQDIDDLRTQMLEDMQEAIDKWNEEQLIMDHQKMDNLVTYLQSNLTAS